MDFQDFLKFWLICLKTELSKKLSDIAFAYLLYPIMLRHLKKKSLYQGQGYKKDCIIFAQIGSKLSILPRKRYFGTIDCYHCITTVYLHANTFKRNP